MKRTIFDSSEYYKAKENFDGYCLGCGAKIGFTRSLFLTKAGDLRQNDPPNKLMCCNDVCVDLFLKRTLKNWGELRLKAFKRDNYLCQDCGVGPAWPFYWETWKKSPKLVWHYPNQSSLEECKEPVLEAHHFVPISEGGDEFDLDNLITLCFDCHHLGRHGSKEPTPEEVAQEKTASIRAKHFTLDQLVKV